MAESTQTPTFQTIAKRKLEKIKAKFAEFFSSSSSSSSSTPVKQQNTVSNYYYGYKTNSNPVQAIPNNSSIFNSNLIDNFMNISIDDDEFEANIFDKEFMINYITLQLIQKIKQSDLIRILHLDLRLPSTTTTAASNYGGSQKVQQYNLLHKIAHDIYTQCESEPCGIRGCKLSINLALNDTINNKIEINFPQMPIQQKQQPNEQIIYYLNKFRFDTQTSLTTFELKLTLREDQNIFCLRKFLPKTKFFDKLRSQSAIYLDKSFDLVKYKLY